MNTITKNLAKEIRSNGQRQKTQNTSVYYPVEAFSAQLQEIIYAQHESTGQPIDFICSAILVAFATAIGNSHRGHFVSGWITPAIIYMVIAGRAGAAKTPAMQDALFPLEEKDKLYYMQFEHEKAQREIELKISKEEQKERGIDPSTLPEIKCKKLVIKEATMEAVIQSLKDNPRGMVQHADEIMGLFGDMNKYNNGSDAEKWLEMWGGGTLISDRKTTGRTMVSNVCLSVIGSTQTAMLAELSNNNRGKNGFIHRFLFAFNTVAKKEALGQPVAPELKDKYRTFINRLLEMEVPVDQFGNLQPTPVYFSPDAYNVWYQWHLRNNDLVNNADDFTAGIYTKLENYSLRLCLVLHMMEIATGGDYGTTVVPATVENALKLIEYYRETALNVQSIVSNESPVTLLSKDKQELYAALPETFETGAGQLIAEQYGMKERTYKNFIKDKRLFERVKYGTYGKIAA